MHDKSYFRTKVMYELCFASETPLAYFRTLKKGMSLTGRFRTRMAQMSTDQRIVRSPVHKTGLNQ
jgi:hypothetical protein